MFYSKNMPFLFLATNNSEKDGPSTTCTAVLALSGICTKDDKSCSLNAKDREVGKLSPFLMAPATPGSSIQEKRNYSTAQSQSGGKS